MCTHTFCNSLYIKQAHTQKVFYLTCRSTKYFVIHSSSVCLLPHFHCACLLSWPVSPSITCLLLAQKTIHLLITHSLGMSVSDSASPPIHSLSPHLSSTLLLCQPFSPQCHWEDKHKIPNGCPTLESLCYTDGQADSAAEEWIWCQYCRVINNTLRSMCVHTLCCTHFSERGAPGCLSLILSDCALMGGFKR